VLARSELAMSGSESVECNAAFRYDPSSVLRRDRVRESANGISRWLGGRSAERRPVESLGFPFHLVRIVPATDTSISMDSLRRR